MEKRIFSLLLITIMGVSMIPAAFSQELQQAVPSAQQAKYYQEDWDVTFNFSKNYWKSWGQNMDFPEDNVIVRMECSFLASNPNMGSCKSTDTLDLLDGNGRCHIPVDFQVVFTKGLVNGYATISACSEEQQGACTNLKMNSCSTAEKYLVPTWLFPFKIVENLFYTFTPISPKIRGKVSYVNAQVNGKFIKIPSSVKGGKASFDISIANPAPKLSSKAAPEISWTAKRATTNLPQIQKNLQQSTQDIIY